MANPIDEHVERLQAVVDKYHAEGMDTLFIVAALIEVTVKASQLDRDRFRAATYLDDASDFLAAAAHNLRRP